LFHIDVREQTLTDSRGRWVHIKPHGKVRRSWRTGRWRIHCNVASDVKTSGVWSQGKDSGATRTAKMMTTWENVIATRDVRHGRAEYQST
jgi:hypothetical protein